MHDRLRSAALDLAAALGLLATTVALLWRSIRPGRTLVPGGILSWFTPFRGLVEQPNNGALGDPAIQFYPWLHYLGDALRSGRVPAWNPFILGGIPMTPNGFVSTWYPPFWIVRWLEPFDAYNFFVAGHLWWGAVGIFVFARCLSVRRPAALVVSALALAAGIWVHWSLHLVHLVGMVWLPWSLAAAQRLIDRPSPGRIAALAGVFGLWWLGANPQYAYFGSLAMGVYVATCLLQSRTHLLRRSAAFVCAITLGALLAAPVLLPSVTIGRTILRDREPATAMSTSHVLPSELVRMVVADARGNTSDNVMWRTNAEVIMDSPFIGVTALVLIGAGVAAGRRGRWALVTVAMASLLLSVSATPHRFLHAFVPGYDRFRVSARWVSVLPAVALPLAALGLDALLEGRRWAKLGAICAAATAGCSLAAWWSWQRAATDAPHAYFDRRALAAGLVLGVALLAALAARRLPSAALAALTIAIVFELVSNTPRWYPRTREATAYPTVDVASVARERGGRVVRLGETQAMISTFSSNVPMAYGVEDVQGQSVMFPRDYDRYLRLIADHGDWVKFTNVAPDVPSKAAGSPLLDAIDARTILAESTVSAPLDGAVLSAAGEPRIYANPGAQPAMFVLRAVPATSNAMWRSVADPNWRPEETSAVVGLARVVEGGGGRVVSEKHRVDEEDWTVEAPQGGLFRVGARYATGWHASIDGHPTEVLLADGIFRAIVLPPGRHAVSFHYVNRDEIRGLWIGILALVVVLGLPLAPWEQGRRLLRFADSSRRPSIE